MVNIISRIKRNFLPVVDDQNKLLGVVDMDDMRNIMFRPELYHKYRAEQFMKPIPYKVKKDDTMELVMHAFNETSLWELPVVDNDGEFVGFVLKSKILETYRATMVEFSED